MRAATGLSSSIGIAPNKLLAKIASELDKPDGVTIVRVADISQRIWPLPPRRINGIGPKAAAKLETLGIHTIGELAQTDPEWLVEQFGRHAGAWMHEAAHGRDERPVVTHMEPKSISRETTLVRDLSATRDREELSQIFTDLCVNVAGDLQRSGYAGRTIGLKLRFDNFRTVTRDQTIPEATQDAADDPSRRRRVPEARHARAADPPARRAYRRADSHRRGRRSARERRGSDAVAVLRAEIKTPPRGRGLLSDAS